MNDKVKKLLEKQFVILDGGFGTELQKRGMKPGETSEIMNFQREDDVYAIHSSYIEAGANIINANTFGANRLKLAKTQYSTAEVVRKALSIAKRAAEGTDTLVALDIGPTGQLLEPAGTLAFEDAYYLFREIVEAGRDLDDLILIETMTALYEIKA
ncbi:MAG: homocysteine S-methyltransferase family protein, partial [Ruminiclostridium sp.]|nr:homocysteine S-methyltransferase family protein [Ruminiclostridium sp.]